MNLRQYKNTTKFNATDAWKYPGPKAFSPKMQYKETNNALQDKNQGFSAKFADKHHEKNAGEIMHMVRKNDVYSNIGWMTSLRGDRKMKAPPMTTAKKVKRNDDYY